MRKDDKALLTAFNIGVLVGLLLGLVKEVLR